MGAVFGLADHVQVWVAGEDVGRIVRHRLLPGVDMLGARFGLQGLDFMSIKGITLSTPR